MAYYVAAYGLFKSTEAVSLFRKLIIKVNRLDIGSGWGKGRASRLLISLPPANFDISYDDKNHACYFFFPLKLYAY